MVGENGFKKIDKSLKILRFTINLKYSSRKHLLKNWTSPLICLLHGICQFGTKKLQAYPTCFRTAFPFHFGLPNFAKNVPNLGC